MEEKGDIQGRKMNQEDKQYYDKIQYAGLLTNSIKNIQIAINTGTDNAGEEVSGLYTLLLPDIKLKLDPHISFFRDRLNEYAKHLCYRSVEYHYISYIHYREAAY